jgi:hypothetical protein
LTQRWRLALPRLDIRFGWLVLVAFALQLATIYAGLGEAAGVRRLAFPASYAILLVFIALNRRRIGFLVIGIGMTLNFLAILANGGLMPISPTNMEKVGLGGELADLELGDAVPQSKNVLLEEGDTHLQWLTDRLTWDSVGPFHVFSVGDVVIAAGILITLIEFLLPVVARNASRNHTSVT